jgi:hypothetical protein
VCRIFFEQQEGDTSSHSANRTTVLRQGSLEHLAAALACIQICFPGLNRLSSVVNFLWILDNF